MAKHGLSWKGYFIALVAFPPAAVIIALRLPGRPRALRLAAAASVIAIHTALLLGGLGLIVSLLD